MSIPIPLVLALLSRNNSSQRNIQNKTSTALVAQTPQQRVQPVRSPNDNNFMVSRLSSVAGLIGGHSGAQIGKIANVMKTINNINQPANMLSLLTRGNNPANILSTLSNNNQSNKGVPNMSDMYSNINNALSNMDSQKKDELLSMAKNFMGKIN